MKFCFWAFIVVASINEVASFTGGPGTLIPKQSPSTSLGSFNAPVSDWSGKTGDTALRQVQFLASKVAESTAGAEEKKSKFVGKRGPTSVRGIGGLVYNNPEFNRGVRNEETTAESSILSPNLEISTSAKREEQVWTALANLELDSKLQIGFMGGCLE